MLHVTLRVLLIVQYVGNSDVLNRREQKVVAVCAKNAHTDEATVSKKETVQQEGNGERSRGKKVRLRKEIPIYD